VNTETHAIISYAITPSAWEILFGDARQDRTWFDWVAENGGEGLALTRINRIVSAQDEEALGRQVLRWAKNAHREVDRLLVCSDSDVERGVLDSLDGDVRAYQIGVVPRAFEVEEHRNLRALLKEPEPFFIKGWSFIRLYGRVDGLHFRKHSASTWLAYAAGLGEWLLNQRATVGTWLTELCPDFSSWKSESGCENATLSYKNTFGAGAIHEANAGSSVMHRLGFVKFHAMRDMPCCGVGVRSNGDLVPMGALTDERDASGRWLWDDGSICAAAKGAGLEDSFAWVFRELSVAMEVLGAEWLKPSAARAGGGPEVWTVQLFGGDEVKVMLHATQMRAIPYRPSGKVSKFWLSAISINPLNKTWVVVATVEVDEFEVNQTLPVKASIDALIVTKDNPKGQE